jgi:predicted alpha/beta hydrolase
MNDPLKKQIGGKHYRIWKRQPIKFIRENNLSFIFGVMIKYIMRVASRTTPITSQIEDLDKLIHYAQIEKEELENEKHMNDIANNCPHEGQEKE